MNDPQQNERIMAEAGIAHNCRNREVKFGLFGEGGLELSRWLKEQALKDLPNGRGVAVVGEKEDALYAFQLLARGVLLGLHQDTRIISLPRIREFIAAREAYAAVANLDCLFIEGFFSNHYKGQPYTDDQLTEMEWFFQWFLKRGGVLFFLVTNRLRDCSWWSPMLLGALTSHTMEVEVK